MKAANYIVASGKQFPCEVPVVPWAVHGKTFPGLKPRKRTDLVTLHWTGSENGIDVLFASMRSSSLSVHFFVDADGLAYQFNDCDAFAAHAKGMNDRSVGIEIQNRANDKRADRGVKRALVKETINGRDFVYSMFTPPQVRTAIALASAICAAYRIPAEVPTADGDVIPRELTEAEFKAFRGVIGHYHWSQRRKLDPGLALMRAFAAQHAREEIGLNSPAQ